MALDATNQNLVFISKLFATLGTRVLHWGSALRNDPKMAAEVTKVGYIVPGFFFPSHLLVRCNGFLSLCTDVPTPSGNIGIGDVCESPSLIVFRYTFA